MLALTVGCGGGGDAAGPPGVATITLDQTALSLAPGATVSLNATVRDGKGNVLSGRTITWTSSAPTIASVSPSGVVTAVAPGGPVIITATCEGHSASGSVTVVAPVTSVTISGAARVKVGDTYTYTATARIADGSVVVRPVTWSVADPTTANMSPGGVLVPLTASAITLRATIDGVAWTVTTNAYDWVAFGSGLTRGLGLTADVRITNKFGTDQYPDLLIGCSAGTFVVGVSMSSFITNNGAVAFSFDGGTPITQTWLETSDFHSLAYPGTTNQLRTSFASAIAGSRIFAFAFTEFLGTAKATAFRVTGLSALLPSLISACQLTSPVVTSNRVAPNDAELHTAFESLMKAAGRTQASTNALKSEAALRARVGPGAIGGALSVKLKDEGVTSRMAVRQH